MAASVWKGPLISIPIRLFRAARSERVPLRELYRAESSAFAHTDESDMPASEPMRNLVSSVFGVFLSRSAMPYAPLNSTFPFLASSD
jgi:hypothetical protein